MYEYAEGVIELVVDKDDDTTIYVYTCPFCNSLFGVDGNYIENSLPEGDSVICPMCAQRMRVD